MDIEEPVACWDGASFHFHATLTRMLGSTLIRDEVVQVRQPRQKRRLAPLGMLAAFHREPLPLEGIMGVCSGYV